MKGPILILLTFWNIFFPIDTQATAQMPDILIYHDERYPLFVNPLESRHDVDSLKSIIKGGRGSCGHTACHREYQAEWTIMGDELYLSGIFRCCENDTVDLATLFGNDCVNGMVKANWVSGGLYAPHGNLIHYVHAEYASTYDRDFIFHVENGRLTGITTYEHPKAKASVYTDEIRLLKFIYSNINWPLFPAKGTEIRAVVRFSANEEGMVDSVEILKSAGKVYDNEVIRVIKSIPGWEISYCHGCFERNAWILPIRFSEEFFEEYGRD